MIIGLTDKDWEELDSILNRSKHSGLIKILEHIRHELDLSDKAIKEGYERDE